MNFLERIKYEWELQGKEHVPFMTEDEVAKIRSENFFRAGKIQLKLGRPLSDRELEDLRM